MPARGLWVTTRPVRVRERARWTRPTRQPARLIAVFAVALQPFLALLVTAALANLEAARRFVTAWRAREPSGPVGA